jgi:hypothetical protein
MKVAIKCDKCGITIAYAETNPFAQVKYTVKCDCGAEKVVMGLSEPAIVKDEPKINQTMPQLQR